MSTGTQEELVGTSLVLRRPRRITAHLLAGSLLSVAAWFATVLLATYAVSASGSLWLLLPALVLAVFSLTATVLTVRAGNAKIVLTQSRVTVNSLAGRTSAPWSEVQFVHSDRPYFGLLGLMPILKLNSGQAISVDALAQFAPSGTDHPDSPRIRQYLQLPGLPAVSQQPAWPQPAGAAVGGELVIRWGGLLALPNRGPIVARVLAGRLLLPALWVTLGVSLVAALVESGSARWEGASVAVFLCFASALVITIVRVCLWRPGVLDSGWYRNTCAVGGVAIAWPGIHVEVDETVNLWGTRFIGHLVVQPAGVPGVQPPPVTLWETCRVIDEAVALAQVVRTY